MALGPALAANANLLGFSGPRGPRREGMRSSVRGSFASMHLSLSRPAFPPDSKLRDSSESRLSCRVHARFATDITSYDALQIAFQGFRICSETDVIPKEFTSLLIAFHRPRTELTDTLHQPWQSRITLVKAPHRQTIADEIHFHTEKHHRPGIDADQRSEHCGDLGQPKAARRRRARADPRREVAHSQAGPVLEWK